MEKWWGTLSFLNIELKIKHDNFDSRIWRKSTNTGVFVNFRAICSLAWKTRLFFCVLNREKTICSNEKLFYSEIKELSTKTTLKF